MPASILSPRKGIFDGAMAGASFFDGACLRAVLIEDCVERAKQACAEDLALIPCNTLTFVPQSWGVDEEIRTQESSERLRARNDNGMRLKNRARRRAGPGQIL